jgi:hypothetical protein
MTERKEIVIAYSKKDVSSTFARLSNDLCRFLLSLQKAIDTLLSAQRHFAPAKDL